MNALKNEYRSRIVTEKDSKGCVVCYRPTLLVLVSSDSRDFLYCCRIHLKDNAFAMPLKQHDLHIDFDEIETQLSLLESKIRLLEKQIIDSKPAVWSSLWSNKMLAASKNSTETDVDSIENGQKYYTELTKERNQIQLELAAKRRMREQYVFKVFELDKSIFASRIQAKLTAKKAHQQARKIADPSYFPTVPQNKPS